MSYDGPDRRHSMENCPQGKRLDKIELSVEKAISEYALTRETLVEIKTLLAERIKKYDDHIEQGISFRSQMANTTLGIIVTLVIAIVGWGVAYGAILNKVEISFEHSMDEKNDSARYHQSVGHSK